MADIRALMAQERQARRVNHEFASYTKAGVLMCTACQLNIKSETLWDGHLRSANHKANVKKSHQVARTVVKRKIEDVDSTQNAEDADARKKLKPKSRTPSEILQTPPLDPNTSSSLPIQTIGQTEPLQQEADNEQVQSVQPVGPDTTATNSTQTATTDNTAPQIDEDEWAAFERDVAPLVQPDYSIATISAAPVSAAQLEAEAESDRKRLRDTEAEDEKEDEGRRIEEEFEVMEEMEERVRKLREKREALRTLHQPDADTGQPQDQSVLDEVDLPHHKAQESSDDSEDDIDDWYS